MTPFPLEICGTMNRLDSVAKQCHLDQYGTLCLIDPRMSQILSQIRKLEELLTIEVKNHGQMTGFVAGVDLLVWMTEVDGTAGNDQ